MKSQNLIVIAASICLLVGTSGTAQEATTCAVSHQNPEDGLIQNEFVQGNVSVFGDCVIENSIILGDVLAELGRDESLVLHGSIVIGQVLVVGGSAAIDSNIFPGGHGTTSDGISITRPNRIVINGTDNQTAVSNNLLQGPGDILINGSPLESSMVLIYSNTVTYGNIRCVGAFSHDASGFDTDAIAYDNIVPQGKVTCVGR